MLFDVNFFLEIKKNHQHYLNDIDENIALVIELLKSDFPNILVMFHRMWAPNPSKKDIFLFRGIVFEKVKITILNIL